MDSVRVSRSNSRRKHVRTDADRCSCCRHVWRRKIQPRVLYSTRPSPRTLALGHENNRKAPELMERKQYEKWGRARYTRGFAAAISALTRIIMSLGEITINRIAYEYRLNRFVAEHSHCVTEVDSIIGHLIGCYASPSI